MKIDEIEYLARRFRAGVDRAHELRLFKNQPFNDFPNACCGDTPDLLAQYLMEHYHNNIKYRSVYGTFRFDDFNEIFGHRWLVLNNRIIVDVTSDQRQFKNTEIFPQDANMPCFVGTNSDFHSLFEIVPDQCTDFYGLETMNECTYLRLKKLYDIIIENIE